MTEFSRKLKQARKAAKLSQEQVSLEIGISRSAISKYENGDLEPNIETITKLMKLYQINSAYLFEETEKTNDYN